MKHCLLVYFVLAAVATIAAPVFAIDHGSDITANATWSPADNPHRITASIKVRTHVTLTVQPGCEVRLVGSVRFTIQGSLIATGTEGSHIQWTSDQSPGHAGDWQSIYVDYNATQCTLEYCDFAYGGGDPQYGMLHIVNDLVTVSDCSFSDCSSNAVLTQGIKTVTVEGCSFARVQAFPISVDATTVHLLNDITFTDCDKPAVEVRGGTLGSGNSVTWHRLEPPFLASSDLLIASGANLTIAAGAVLKFNGGVGMAVSGNLTAMGAADDPIIFTSVNDDEHGGDSAGDGATSGQAGDWTGLALNFQSSSNSLAYCTVLYAGSDPSHGAVFVQAQTGDFSHCSVQASASDGMIISTGSTASVGTCSFTGNHGFPLSLTAPNVSGIGDNTYESNLYQAIEIQGGTLEGSGAWDWKNPGIPYVVSQTASVAGNQTLTIDPGVILKFAGAAGLAINGKLTALGTAAAPIVFTSSRDDANGGDSNADGAATQPAAGDWLGLNFIGQTVDAGQLQYCVIQYGGSDRANIYAERKSPDIANCWITKSGHDGVYYGNYSATHTIAFCDITENEGLGVNHYDSGDPHDSVIARNNWWGDAGGPYDPSAADGRSNPHGAGDGVSDYVDYIPWRHSPFEVNNGAPVVQLAGYWDTYVSTSAGGHFILVAYVTDPDGAGDVASVDFFVSGVPAGLSMFDDGTNGDWQAGDSIYTFAVDGIPAGATANNYLLTITAHDRFNEPSAEWPFLTATSATKMGGGLPQPSWQQEAHGWKYAGPDAPRIMAGGYLDTNITYEVGGLLTFFVYATGANGEQNIDHVELYFANEPTGIYFNPGFSLNLTIPPYSLPAGEYLLQAVAVDDAGNESTLFPHFTIVP